MYHCENLENESTMYNTYKSIIQNKNLAKELETNTKN